MYSIQVKNSTDIHYLIHIKCSLIGVGRVVTRVSVIIPTWNRAKSISRAVRSALGQTVSPLEVLVCDDGSTDQTRDVVHRINDPRVRWIQGAHSGLPAVPRNHGITAAKGEWIAFLDSDDEWLPEKLELQLAAAERFKVRAVCSNAFRVTAIPETAAAVLLQYPKPAICFSDLLRENFVVCSSMMVNKELLEDASRFPEDPSLVAIEDYALWLRVAIFTNIAFLQEPLLNYNDDPQNSLRRESLTLFQQRKRILNDLLSWGRDKQSVGHYIWEVRRQYFIEQLRAAAAIFVNRLTILIRQGKS